MNKNWIDKELENECAKEVVDEACEMCDISSLYPSIMEAEKC